MVLEMYKKKNNKVLGALYQKYKKIILYIVFGVITTVINIFLYWLFFKFLKWESFAWGNVAANVIAWVGAVSVAFLTNKNLVFGSDSWHKKVVIREFITFILARIATGVVDLAIMFIFVDCLRFNGVLIKIIANIIVIILNFILSKVVVFKRG